MSVRLFSSKLKRSRNRSRSSSIKTCLKSFDRVLKLGDGESINLTFNTAKSMIDRASGMRLLKKNKASRLVSRLSKILSKNSSIQT